MLFTPSPDSFCLRLMMLSSLDAAAAIFFSYCQFFFSFAADTFITLMLPLSSILRHATSFSPYVMPLFRFSLSDGAFRFFVVSRLRRLTPLIAMLAFFFFFRRAAFSLRLPLAIITPPLRFSFSLRFL